MTKTSFDFKIAGVALTLLFLVACSRSSGLNTPGIQGRQTTTQSVPIDTEEDITRAIAAMRYTALNVGLGFPAERPGDPDGAQSGVHDYQCSDSGRARFDETLKETTYFDCQRTAFEALTLFTDGIIDESCRGQTGEIRCFGAGTTDEPLFDRIFDDDEEIGGEFRAHVVRNAANTIAIEDVISIDGAQWRSRPVVMQVSLIADSLKLTQSRNDAGNTEAAFDGTFFIASDEGFNCTSGSLMTETLAPIEMNNDDALVGGQVRFSSKLGHTVTVDFLPDGSAIYRSTIQVGAITSENLRKYCQTFTITESLDVSANPLARLTRLTATRLLPLTTLPRR